MNIYTRSCTLTTVMSDIEAAMRQLQIRIQRMENLLKSVAPCTDAGIQTLPCMYEVDDVVLVGRMPDVALDDEFVNALIGSHVLEGELLSSEKQLFFCLWPHDDSCKRPDDLCISQELLKTKDSLIAKLLRHGIVAEITKLSNIKIKDFVFFCYYTGVVVPRILRLCPIKIDGCNVCNSRHVAVLKISAV